jgi:hypothetical protein
MAPTTVAVCVSAGVVASAGAGVVRTSARLRLGTSGVGVVVVGFVAVVSAIVSVEVTYTSRIVVADRPPAPSAELRLSRVRLADIAMAVFSFGACTLVSTRTPVDSKRLRAGRLLSMSRIRSMLTSALDTPAARATDCLNVICALLLNSCMVRGSATAILTTYGVGCGVVVDTTAVVDVVVGTGVVVVDVGTVHLFLHATQQDTHRSSSTQ